MHQRLSLSTHGSRSHEIRHNSPSSILWKLHTDRRWRRPCCEATKNCNVTLAASQKPSQARHILPDAKESTWPIKKTEYGCGQVHDRIAIWSDLANTLQHRSKARSGSSPWVRLGCSVFCKKLKCGESAICDDFFYDVTKRRRCVARQPEP